MHKYFRTTMMLTFLVLGSASLSSCNTMEGAGKDVERAGETLQDAAN